MDNFIHLFDEGIFVTAASQAHNGVFWLMYNADYIPGIAAFDEHHEYVENQMYAIRFGIPVGLNQFDNPITNISNAYPNPVSGQSVCFDLNLSKTSSRVEVNVYNIAGQVVSSEKLTGNVGMNRILVETANLTSGMYLCSIIVDDHKETRKFVVH
jgi:hypothetical protein